MDTHKDKRLLHICLLHSLLLGKIDVLLPGKPHRITHFGQFIGNQQSDLKIDVLLPDAVPDTAVVKASMPRIYDDHRLLFGLALLLLLRSLLYGLFPLLLRRLLLYGLFPLSLLLLFHCGILRSRKHPARRK